MPKVKKKPLQFSPGLMRFQIEGSAAVEIPLHTLQKIEALALESRGQETGGILVGHNDGIDVRVSQASDAGPNAQRSASHFLRDTEYCRGFLDQAYSDSGADYVGEWHSHVVSLRR
jgi:integrative and conjugative element protein (TIGR02256 family)